MTRLMVAGRPSMFHIHNRRMGAEAIGVSALTLLALVVRIYHLDWALPYTYEEATPLHTAWNMWGWDRNCDVNLNPEFFRYPSLTFYVHFLVQGALYLVMHFTSAIDSLGDWRIMYLVDPSPLFLAARAVSVGFGVATGLVAYKTTKTIAGTPSALLVLALLAVNPFHLARSQMVEVDIPLTFFCALALHGAIRVALNARRRDYVVAGLATGLAASSKYTGVLLIAPLLIAYVLATKTRPRKSGGRDTAGRKHLWVGIVAALVAFCVTSPYVVLDARDSLADILIEREHMAVGHFGADSHPTWIFYANALVGSVLGAPITALSILGLVGFAVRGQKNPTLVLSAFVVAYLGVISSWSMKAERYLLPIVPPLLVFAGIGARVVGDWLTSHTPPRIAHGGFVLLLVTVLAPEVGSHQEVCK